MIRIGSEVEPRNQDVGEQSELLNVDNYVHNYVLLYAPRLPSQIIIITSDAGLFLSPPYILLGHLQWYRI